MADKETFQISKEVLYGAVIVVLVALLALSILTSGFGSTSVTSSNGAYTYNGTKLSDAELKSLAESYINTNLLASGYTAEATNVTVYDDYISVITFAIKQGDTTLQEAEVYITNDGTSLFVGNAFRMNETDDSAGDDTDTTDPQTTTAVTKSDRSEAHAFVMAFCPYGLQFLKAYIPVIELLEDDADLEVNFVYYAMHGKSELDANNYIYCVQEKQKASFTQYLRCFVEAGDYSGCVATVGLDTAEIETCVAELDSQYNITNMYYDESTWLSGNYPLYPVDSLLNTQYGVGGSPTFILNGQRIDYNSCSSDADCNAGTVCTATSSGQKCILNRNPEAIKDAICAAFTTAPAACSTELSTTNEAAGAGPVGSSSGSGSTAECG